MSEFDGQGPASAAMPMEESARGESTATPVSAGTLLRQAREAAGLHIAALAVALKVPVKKLEALESDRLDLLPDAVFVRALASSVCRTLKLDAGPVLALLPQTGKPRLGSQKTSISTPFRSPSDGPGPSLWAQVSRPAVLAGLLLLLGALVMIFLPAVQQQEMAAQPLAGPAAATPQATSASVSASPAQVQESPSPVSSESPVVTAVPAGVMSATPATAPGLSAGSALPLPAASPAEAPAATSVQTTTTSSAAVAGGLIVFTAKGESWVEVTDAKGVVVLRRTLAAGEVAGASGVLPLAAVVGRVDATQVQVRGRAFDLGAVAKDNVARFEVK